MIALAVATLAAFAVFFWIGRRSRKKTPAAVAKTPLDHHVEDQVALIASDKLGVDDDKIASTLRDAPDPELVTLLEAHVQRIELVFERRFGSDPNRIDLSIEVLFDDGKLERRLGEISRAWLPADVDADFARSGAARAHRAWKMPWQR